MKKTISGIVLAGAVLLSSTTTFAQSTVAVPISAVDTVKFIDITGHWAQSAVQKLIEKNAMPYSQDKFIPGKAITRSEFVEMLHDALDIEINYLKEPVASEYFDDVKQDTTYTMDLIDLVTAKIIDDEGRKFNSNETLSREMMIHYIMNTFKYELGDVFAYIKIKGGFFADHNQITPLYSGDVDLAAHYKLISGYGKSIFNPKANATRAEAAMVISKLVDYLEKEQLNVVIKPEASLKKDSLEMKISIANNSKRSINFEHSSGQKYDFVLLDADRKEIYRWSDGKAFTMMLTSSVIEPGKSIEYSYIMSGKEFEDIKDKAVYFKAYVLGSSDKFKINTDGYEVILK